MSSNNSLNPLHVSSSSQEDDSAINSKSFITRAESSSIIDRDRPPPRTQASFLPEVPPLAPEQPSSDRTIVFTSGTSHVTSTVDLASLSYTMLFELDFKYPVVETMACVPGLVEGVLDDQSRVLDARDMKFPFIITNALALQINKETHFFRRCPAKKQPSMYGDTDEVISSALTLADLRRSNGGGDGSVIWKCEKYVCVVSANCWLNDSDLPFSTLYLLLKIATNGMPGTEKLHLMNDTGDSVWRFPRELGDFKAPSGIEGEVHSAVKTAKVEVSEVKLGEHSTGYPRLYLSANYLYDWRMPVFKYYIVPLMLTITCLVKQYDTDTFVGLASTLILSDIALLFTITGNGSRMEKALTLNLVQLVAYTFIHLGIVGMDGLDSQAEGEGEDEDGLLFGVRLTWMFIVLSSSGFTLYNDVMVSRRNGDVIRQAVEQGNFEILNVI